MHKLPERVKHLNLQLERPKPLEIEEPSIEKRVNLRLGMCSLQTLSTMLMKECRVGLAYSDELAEKEINGNFTEESVENVIRLISLSLGQNYRLVGKTYYIGDVTSLDRVFFVRRVYFYTADEVSAMIQGIISGNGQYYVTRDCMLVVRDGMQSVREISMLLDMISNDMPMTYQVEIKLFAFGSSQSAALDAATRIGVEAMLSRGAHSWNSLVQTVANLELGLEKNLEIIEVDCMCLDGGKATVEDVTKTPIANKTVSDSGTVTTSGYTSIDVGFTINLLVRTGTNDRYLSYEITNGVLLGYNDNYPVSTEYKTTGDMVCNGDVNYLGCVYRRAQKRRFGLSGFGDSVELKKYLVFARVVPVRLGAASDVSSQEPQEAAASPDCQDKH